MPGWATSLDRWGLRIALALAIAAALVMLRPSNCHGQDEQPDLPDVSGPCAPELTDNRRAVIEHDYESGVWFHLDVARCMLGRLSSLPLYAHRVSLLEQRLEISDERASLLRKQVDLAEQGEQQAVQVLEKAEAGRRRAEEKLNAWYRHPVFLMGAGAVLVIALEVAALAIFDRID